MRSSYPYFAYPFMEKRLSAFFDSDDIPLASIRLYSKLRYCAILYADIDYAGEPTREHAIARGWEEIRMGFSGRAEQFLSYLIWQIWSSLPAEQHDDFELSIKESIQLADDNTSLQATRLHTSKDRSYPLIRIGREFEFVDTIPIRGPRLREWAIKRGVDPDKIERQWHFYEEQDRTSLFKEIKAKSVDNLIEEQEQPFMGKGQLRLIPGGKNTSSKEDTNGK